MSTSILVPLDGSPFAEHALPVAFEIARRMAAHLHIVRAQELPVGRLEAIIPADPEWLAALRAEDEEYLRTVAGRCVERTGLVVRTDLLPGPAASSVVGAARDGGDSMIVMTTHGRGGVSRAWMGSVADAVVRRSSVPVLLIRPDRAEVDFDSGIEPRHVLVPVDGSPLSEGIIEPALAVGKLTGARYTLLRVMPSFPLPIYPLGISVAGGQEAFEEMRRDVRNYLDSLAARLRAAHAVDVDTALVEDSIPAAAILQQADERGVDMIALATHGRGGWTRMALGSVADKVMRGARVPVLLYRPPVPITSGEGPSEAVHAA